MSEPTPVQGRIRRHFVEYDHPKGAFTLRAHRVTEKTVGEVQTPGGPVVTPAVGDYLVETGRPDVYEVHSGDAFDEMNLAQNGEQEDWDQDADVTDEPEEFDPSTHSAAETRLYLRSLDTDTDEGQAEWDRVVEAERAGKNRNSAVPQR